MKFPPCSHVNESNFVALAMVSTVGSEVRLVLMTGVNGPGGDVAVRFVV